MRETRVRCKVYSCDGAWWCKLYEARSAPRADWPPSSQGLLWAGATPDEAVAKCREFLRRATFVAANVVAASEVEETT